MPLRRVPVARPARQAHARRRGGRDRRGTRLLIDTPPELRLQLIAAGSIASTRCCSRTTTPITRTASTTSARSRCAAIAPLPMYGAGGDARRSAQQKFRYIFDDRIRPLPGRRSRRGRAHPLAAGRADRDRRRRRHCRSRCRTAASRSSRIGSGRSPTSPTRSRCRRSAIAAAARREGARDQRAVPHRHPTHLSFAEAVAAARAIGAERTYLTHLTHDNFHADLEAELPRGIVAGVRRAHRSHRLNHDDPHRLHEHDGRRRRRRDLGGGLGGRAGGVRAAHDGFERRRDAGELGFLDLPDDDGAARPVDRLRRADARAVRRRRRARHRRLGARPDRAAHGAARAGLEHADDDGARRAAAAPRARQRRSATRSPRCSIGSTSTARCSSSRRSRAARRRRWRSISSCASG